MKRADITSRRTAEHQRPSIRSIPFLDGPPVLRMTARERDHLATISTVMRVPAGSILCHCGHEAKAVFSVTSAARSA